MPRSRRSFTRWALVVLLALVVALAIAWRQRDRAATSSPSATASSATADAAPRQPRAAPSEAPPAARRVKVYGRVTDGSDRPLVAARVCAVPRPGVRLISRHSCVESDAEGRYRLTLDPGGWRLGAAAKGWAPSTYGPQSLTGRVSLRAGEDQRFDFVLDELGHEIQGRVFDSFGGAIEAALVGIGHRVELRQPGALAKTDEQGRFALDVPAGLTSLTAFAHGYAPATVRVHDASEAVEIFLVPETVVRGRVIADDSGDPIAGATIEGTRSQEPARSDAEGRFSVAIDPARGETLIGRAPGLFGQLELPPGSPGEPREVELRLGEGVDLRIELSRGDERCPEGGIVMSDGRGFHEYRISSDEAIELVGVPTHEIELMASCLGAVSDRDLITLEPPGPATLRFELEPVGRLSGRVVDGDGQPLARVQVYARGPINTAEPSDGLGLFRIEGLAPGRYVLEAQDERRGLGSTPHAVELGRDDLEVELELIPRAEVRGRLLDPEGRPAAYVRLSLSLPELRRGVGWETTDAEGRFRFSAVPPGPVSLFCGGLLVAPAGETPKQDRVALEVHGADDLELELTTELRARTLEVEVVDATGQPVVGVDLTAWRDGQPLGSSLRFHLESARTDASGCARFERVPAGTIEVHGAGESVRLDATQDSVRVTCTGC